jgi:WD40 repeat protein
LQSSALTFLARSAGPLWACLGLVLTAHGQTAADAGHAQLVAEARRTPAELRRRPDGLEEVEAITRGASVPAWPTAVTFHPDGTRVALLDDSGAVDLWHWQEDRHIRREVAYGYQHQLAFSHDGTMLIAAEGQERGYLHLWNAQNGALQAQLGRSRLGLFIEEPSRFWQLGDRLLAFLPASIAEYRGKRRLRSSAATDSLPLPSILSEIRDRRETKTWTPPSPIHALHVSAAGRWLALVVSREQSTWLTDRLLVEEPTISRHGAVEVYDVDSGKRRAVFHPQGAAAFGMTSSSDGSLLITSSYQTSPRPSARQRAEVWDAKSGQRLAELAAESPHLMLSRLLPPAFPISSGDGRRLIFAQGARHVLWDAQTRQTRALSTAWGSAAFVAGTSLLIARRCNMMDA